MCFCICCFFYQEEDGIRYRNVTGVQTCALPILLMILEVTTIVTPRIISSAATISWRPSTINVPVPAVKALTRAMNLCTRAVKVRSEERRVGKECRGEWAGEWYRKVEELRGRERR